MLLMHEKKYNKMRAKEGGKGEGRGERGHGEEWGREEGERR